MPKRQLAMVFDPNKCIGCQTCTIACKQLWTNREGREAMYWNNVETMPGRGYPKDWQTMGGGMQAGKVVEGRRPSSEEYGVPWQYNHERVLLKGAATTVEPHVRPTWGPNWDEDEGAGQWPNSYYFYLPRICNHCSKPACVAACPRKAIYKREEDGIVLVDQARCRGYRHCVAACPYKKVYFNITKYQSEKCILCYPRIEKGEVPACAAQCVGRVRFVGYKEDTAGPIHKLVEQWKVALPLHPEFGTEPNVFYVPPTSPPSFTTDGRIKDPSRIPLTYLEELFGPQVRRALATLTAEMDRRRRGEKSELMEILIGYTNKGRFKLA